MNEAVREMTFEEEAVLYEKSARELFAKESPGCEAPPINHLVRRGMRIIRKAREEIKRKHGRWVDYMVRDWRCSVCGEKIAKVRNVDGYCYEDKPHYCPNCGARMDGE